MGVNINKEMLQKAGEVSLRVGKRIIIEGTKAVVLKGTIATMEAKFEGKEVNLDTILGDKKETKEKKSFFKRKKKVKIESDVVESIADAYVEGIKEGVIEGYKEGLDAGAEAVKEAIKFEED